ncbi:MAG: primosomal protein N', partial [Bacteroidetes bacterium]|nr:primosomal protein N' [Bacteroidota bacterium]
FKYPPFYRLIDITLRHKDLDMVNEAADYFTTLLKHKLGNRVLGPEFPVVSRVKNYYLKGLLIKVEKESSISKVKLMLRSYIDELNQSKDFKAVQVVVDVDPY